jgi:hypothetical protein
MAPAVRELGFHRQAFSAFAKRLNLLSIRAALQWILRSRFRGNAVDPYN